MTDSPLLRVTLDRHEAAKALGVGVSTLDDMTRDGFLPSIHDPRWPGIRLYSVRALERWAEEASAYEEARRGKSVGTRQHLSQDWRRPVGRGGQGRTASKSPVRLHGTGGEADAG